MASSYGVSSFRHEGHYFFIYDHTKKTEEDDPKDAILYFYPRSVGAEDQVALVGGIIGLADFCLEFIPELVPSIVKLSGHHFALLQHEDFIIGLAGSPDVPDKFLIAHMQFVWSTFIFYQGSLEAIRERVSANNFVKELNLVWDMYLPLCQIHGDSLSQAFQMLPYIQLRKSQGSLFLHASHILQRSLRHKGVIAGALFNKNKVLCSHLCNSLTRQLLLLMSHSQFPCVEANSLLELPGGVRLLYVYLPQDECAKLGHRRDKAYTYEASSAEEENAKDSSEQKLEKLSASSSPFEVISFKKNSGKAGGGRFEGSNDSPFSSGRNTKGSMVSPTATLTSGTDSEVFMDTLSDLIPENKQIVKLSDIKNVECDTRSRQEHRLYTPARQESSSSDASGTPIQNHVISVEVHPVRKEEKPPPGGSGSLSSIASTENDDNSKALWNNDTNTDEISKDPRSFALDSKNNMDSSVGEMSRDKQSKTESSSQIPDKERQSVDDSNVNNGATNTSQTPEGACAHNNQGAISNTEHVTERANSEMNKNMSCNQSEPTSVHRNEQDDVKASSTNFSGSEDVEVSVGMNKMNLNKVPSNNVLNHVSDSTSSGDQDTASAESSHTDGVNGVQKSQPSSSDDSSSLECLQNKKSSSEETGENMKTNTQTFSQATEQSQTSGQEKTPVFALSSSENSSLSLSDATATPMSSITEESAVSMSDTDFATRNSGGENALDMRRTLAQSKQEIDDSLETRLTKSEDSSTPSSTELKIDREGSTLSLAFKEITDSKDRLTFESLDSENSEGGIISPLSEQSRLSPVSEMTGGQENDSQQSRSGSDFSENKARFYFPSPSSGSKTPNSSSIRGDPKPRDSSTPSSSQKWDPERNGLQELILYAQGHSDTLLVLLVSRSVKCNKVYVNSLWKSCLSHLAELDFQVKDAERHAKDDSENIGAAYQYMHYDSFTQSLKGSALLPVSSLANEIVDSSVKMHESFTELPELEDITYRSHSACCFGRRTVNKETYFQMGLSRMTAGGISPANDKTFFLSQEAQKYLQKDVNISML